MGKIKKILSPKKPDTSAIEAQEKRIREQEQKIEADQKAKDAEEARKKQSQISARRGRSGGVSLLTGLETGVNPVANKRGTLG